MAQISLAVLGGSSVATPALVQALLDWAGHAQDRPELRVILLGRSARKLPQVRAECPRMVLGAHPLTAPEYLLPLELRTLLFSLGLYEEVAAWRGRSPRQEGWA